MYGDTTVIRTLARRLLEQADDVRAEASVLVARAESVPWTGLAAEAMRHLAREHAGGLRSCAARHDEAATALERHAREVDHLEELIAATERRVMRLLDGAAHELGDAVHALTSHVVPDPLDHWLDHFDPPPHGSRAWLDVRLPRPA